MKYFLSLGSNINAKKNLEFALEELKKIQQQRQEEVEWVEKTERKQMK